MGSSRGLPHSGSSSHALSCFNFQGSRSFPKGHSCSNLMLICPHLTRPALGTASRKKNGAEPSNLLFLSHRGLSGIRRIQRVTMWPFLSLLGVEKPQRHLDAECVGSVGCFWFCGKTDNRGCNFPAVSPRQGIWWHVLRKEVLKSCPEL